MELRQRKQPLKMEAPGRFSSAPRAYFMMFIAILVCLAPVQRTHARVGPPAPWCLQSATGHREASHGEQATVERETASSSCSGRPLGHRVANIPLSAPRCWHLLRVALQEATRA